MSGIPRSLGWESWSPAQGGSSRTLFEPIWPTETPYEASKRVSARAPPQHTDPEERSIKRRDQGATSRGSYIPGRKDVQRGLRYTSATSRTEDSQKLISELRHEINDLKQEARGRTPVKERPRNKVNASKRGNPEYSEYAELSDTSGSQSNSGSLNP